MVTRRQIRYSKQRTVIKMRNFKKLLCVVLVLIVALSAASCSISKSYAYQKDDIELPIGVYIYYLQQAYSEAQSYAQQSDKYDSATGKYDGKKSFLKMEITDDDKNTAIAEDWIKDKAKEYTQQAIAAMREFNKLGATIDELGPNDMISTISPYAIYNQQTGQLDESLDQKLSEVAKTYEKYGIGFDSWLLCNSSLNLMKEAAFQKEYGEGGPKAVKDDEIKKYFTENYYSYTTISAPLYTTEAKKDADGNDTEETESKALSDKEVKKYEEAFKGYAKDLKGGKSMDDVVAAYNKAFKAEATASPSVTKIEKDTEDELSKTVLALKEGEATYKIIGEDATTRSIYLIYKLPIKDSVSEYMDGDSKQSGLLHEMKDDDFDALLKSIIEDGDAELSSACNDYKPEMFEEKEKKTTTS